MRTFAATLCVCITVALAVPASAEPPDGDDVGFLSALNQVGIRFADPARALGAGRAVCGLLNNGESGLELVHDLKIRNPGFNLEDASDFAMISAKFYCPHHLSKA
ncbi:DUF732 domain-containing protein [Candidatus Mycobacterium wuenschmannii]|uniref:DUF732 domain-containing protein n=1 Tax=Candidatus Mycobacterium wuenschmannii TaxID=3027808 RepID=A0ABY8VQ40_9MYCO|nr:DUF732 domain-containing protein [Candidatus Mycobacterium wuenschmannii]WIM85759.1 DUF732 domain-containing protein [Candidatus Mycobacterium wuenschmannii]